MCGGGVKHTATLNTNEDILLLSGIVVVPFSRMIVVSEWLWQRPREAFTAHRTAGGGRAHMMKELLYVSSLMSTGCAESVVVLLAWTDMSD